MTGTNSLLRLLLMVSGCLFWFVTQAGSWRVILPAEPTEAEKTAQAELTDYLTRAIRGDLRLEGQSDVTIHLVRTPALAEEEWQISSRDGAIFIAGGGRRGILYGAYHFLEDVIGIRWWNPAEEYIPQHETLELNALELHGRPFFRQRNLFREPYGMLQDNGRFAARSRLNPDGHWALPLQYGGSTQIGSPHQVHTFSWYFPEELLATHPEYFALRDGKRRAGMFEQLCLSNPEVKRIFVEKLKAYIAKDEQAARANHTLPPVIYDISQNDNSTPCECDNCRQIVEEEGSQMGPVIRLVNQIAAEIADFRPELKISTLAYNYTEKPAHTRPAANVIIRLCDTTTNIGLNYSEVTTPYFTEVLKEWADQTDELYIWDYAITYGAHRGLPYASEFTLAETHQVWADHGVRYVFWEHEDQDIADMVTLKSYLEIKLMEDPYQNFDTLIHDFMDKYYGAAAPAILEYRHGLYDALRQSGTNPGFMGEMADFGYLTYPVVIAAHERMDQAEAAVANDPLLLSRVRQARMSLDRYTYLNLPALYRQYGTAGGTPEAFPLDKEQLTDRVYGAYQAAFPTLNPARYPEFIAKIEREIRNARAINERVSPPEFFADMPGKILDYPAHTLTLRSPSYQLIALPEAESGMAIQIKTTPECPQLPLLFGVYSYHDQANLTTGNFTPPASATPGFHWYKLGSFQLPPQSDAYLYLTQTWELQLPLQNLMAQVNTEQKFDCWVSLKYEGTPSDPATNPRLLVERVVLVEAI